MYAPPLQSWHPSSAAESWGIQAPKALESLLGCTHTLGNGVLQQVSKEHLCACSCVPALLHQLSVTLPCCVCSVLSEVVDEMISEAWAEVDGEQARAEAFAFDLLVAAVAFSQGKYDITRQVRLCSLMSICSHH